MRQKFETYRTAAVAAGHSVAAVEAAIADAWVVKHVHVAEDDETAAREAGPPFLWYYKLLANRRMFDGPLEPAPLQWWAERGASYFGSPETVAARISDWHSSTGLSNVLCWMNTGGMPAQRVLNSMRLFGERVLPLLRARGLVTARSG